MTTRSVLRRSCSAVALVAVLPTMLAAQTPARVNTASGALTADVLRGLRYRLIGHANTSGRVTAIDVANTPGRRTIYVGFASGGLWKSTNNGTTWTPVFDDAGFTNVSEVAVSNSNPDIVWVGTGERNSLRSQGWGNGVYKSTDAGKTWKQSGLADNTQIGRIAIHPRNADIVYAAAMGDLWGPSPARGVYKTTDGGNTWQKVLFVNDTVAFVDVKMDPSNPEVLYAAGWHRLRRGGGTMEGAGAGSGIWKTTDGGRNWRKLTDPALRNGLPTDAMGRIGLVIAPKNPRTVYAVIQVARSSTGPTVSAQGGVFRSDDAGGRWTRVNDISALPDYFYNEIYVDPSNTERVYINSVQLSVSTDGGKSFAPMEMNRVHVDHHALWIDPDDSKHMLLGNDGGVHVTYDAGETWEHFYHPVGQFYEVNVDSTKTPYHVCGGLQDNGVWCGPSRTRDRAGITNADWYAVYGGDGFHSAVSPDSPNYRFAESQFANVSRCDTFTNRCETVRPAAEDAGVEAGREFRWDWNTPFFISRYDPKTLYLGGNYVFKLTDRGRRWEIISPELTRANIANPEPDTGYTSYHSVHSIAESPRDRNVLWAGTNDGKIWVTQDGGRNWRDVTANIPDTQAQRCVVAEIDASSFDARTAYVAYDCHQRNDYRPYVYRTTDAGTTFTSISGDLPPDAGSWVVREDNLNPRLLFVGNERGLYLSTRGGMQWLRLKNNLPTVSIRDFDIMPRHRELVVGTFGRSIYILDLIPLQELTDSVLALDAHLFTVRDVQAFNAGNTYESYADKFFTAPNPPPGAQISYYLKNDLGRDATLTIRRAGAADDDVVQTLTGSGRPGLNTVTWDLLARRPRPRELGGPTNAQELRQVPDGDYTVSMRVGNATLSRTFKVTNGWTEHTPGRVR